MKIFHGELAGRWGEFSLCEQLSNVGAEVGRAISFYKRKNLLMSKNALYRALELVDLTIADEKNRYSLGEICRMRELLVDYFLGENIYKSAAAEWEKYFLYFNYKARVSD